MEEENIDVNESGTETALEPSLEEEQPVVDDVKEEATDEPVDEMGVPIKNRIAEIERKKRQLSKIEAEKGLMSQPQHPITEDEAVTLLKNVVNEAVAPIKARQFLAENPDAAAMIDEINQVRAQHPEISGIDNLDLAYKIAKAEMQDEIIRRKVEAGQKENIQKQENAKQATLEGAGKTKAPTAPLTDRIKSAGSIEELEQLAADLRK